MPRENPFAELELDPKAEFLTDFTCYRCGKEDHILGYRPNTVVKLSIDPLPTVLCTCGASTFLTAIVE